ncbi:MAG: DNA polymerase I [Lachnospiraceae bacterium]|nr:DNA polymerase I [Lachnospiraceae bacterium]
MSEKLVLIDGHSILNRTFYGIPELTNSEGIHTNAVYGFLNIMFKVLEEEKADYCIVAFDVNHPTFRHQMYAEYKGTRKPMPEELREQVPLMKEVLKSMNISIAELAGYEADDILGTLSKKGEISGMDVAVISGDRDLLQLATGHVQIRIPKTKKGGTEVENYYEDDVKALYGVTPVEFIDMKALMGDTSDNIPGVPGVGEKTAAKLIAQYGSIENMYEHIGEMKSGKIKTSLEEHSDSAKISKELATINTEVPIDINIKDAVLKDMFNNESFKLLKHLELKSILNRFDTADFSNDVENEFKEVKDLDEFKNIIEKENLSDNIGIQIFSAGTYIAAGITFSEEKTYCCIVEDKEIINLMESIFNKAKKISLIDLKSHLKLININDNSKINDVSVEAYLLNPLKDNYQYDDIARDYLMMTVPSRSELLGKEKIEKAIECEREKFIKMLGYCSYISYKASEELERQLEETGMKKIYDDIELPLVFALDRMEKVGVRVEKDALKQYGDELEIKIDELEKKIYGSVGEEFNINSPKQLGEILFVKMGLKGGKKTKTGYSTAANVLEKLADEYPVVSDILRYRQLTKLNSTYAQGLSAYINDDGRIHGTFNQTITATGRISSTEPNLQNIPIRMEIGKAIRKVFVPEEGCVFLDADYSQIELRILAHMSEDGNLIEAYKEAKDIHQATASKVFHVPLDKVTKEQRSNAKAVNFGIIYGISSFGLSQDLSIGRKEAEGYIKDYFATYPKIKACLDGFVSDAKEKGYSVTVFGRRRPIPELKSSNFMQRSFGERIAMNSPIQGTAADIIKIAMVNVDRRLREENLKSRIVLQVHDELLLEVPEDEVSKATEILECEMANAAHLSVPMDVSVEKGKNWLEAH